MDGPHPWSVEKAEALGKAEAARKAAGLPELTDQELAEWVSENMPRHELRPAMVPLRDGRIAMARFEGRHFRDEKRGVEVDIAGEVRDGDLVCVGLTLRPLEGGVIDKRTLRDLPLSLYLKLAVAPFVWVREANVVHTPNTDLEGIVASLPRRKPRITDADLRAVARVYRAAVKRDRPPTAAVAEELHLSRSTAGRRVQIARERGFLGPAPGDRRSGERTTPTKKKARKR